MMIINFGCMVVSIRLMCYIYFQEFWSQFMVIVQPKTILERKMICNVPLIDYRLYVDASICSANPKKDRNMRGSNSGHSKVEKVTIPKSNRPKTKKSRQKYKIR